MEVKNCPISKADKATPKKMENENCPICFDEIDNAEKGVTKCMHTFHDTCILKWMEKSSKCPLCNFELNPVGCEVRFRDFEEIPFSDDYDESDGDDYNESDGEDIEDYYEQKEDYYEQKEDIIPTISPLAIASLNRKLDGMMRSSGFLFNELHLPEEVSIETEFEKTYKNLFDSIDKEDFCRYIGKNRLLTMLEKMQISILTYTE